MASVSGLTRASEWWGYKIPPLLAIGYGLVLLTSLEPAKAVLYLCATITSIISVAAYGYVINDCFDIEVDRKAGKSNSMAGLSVGRRVAVLLAILAIGWMPAAIAGYSWFACLLLAIDYTLPTIYSIPPIRLKERGVLGVLSDAAAAHVIPALFLSSVFLGDPSAPPQYWGFAAVATVWYAMVGLRGIINHQLADRDADLKAGVITLAIHGRSNRRLRWARRLIYLVEMAVFTLVILILTEKTDFLLLASVLYAVLEFLKRGLGWHQGVRQGPEIGRRAYLPFSNNIYYALWLPILLTVELALRWPVLVWLPFAQIALFGRGKGRKREYLEPVEVLRELWTKSRPVLARWRLGWMIVAPPTAWPAARRLSIRPESISVSVKQPVEKLWELRLIGPRYPLSAGESYQLRLRMKSDQPRSVAVGVCQRYRPYRDLGLAEIVPVQMTWEDFFFDFTATATEPAAAIFLWIGGRAGTVAISEATLSCVLAPGPWSIVLTKPAEAWRSRPNDRKYLVRVDRIQPTGVPWHVKLIGRRFHLTAGTRYRVQVAVRSKQRSRFTWGVAQAFLPYDVVGVCETVFVPEEFEEYRADFIPEKDEEVTFFFWLGEFGPTLEVLSVDCRQVEAERDWKLDRVQDAVAWWVGTEDGERAVVHVARAHAEDSDVTVWTPLVNLAPGAYRIRCRIWGSGEDRPVRVGVARIANDVFVTEVSGWTRSGRSTSSLEMDFVVEEAAPSLRFVAWIGGEEGLFEIRDFSVESLTTPPALLTVSAGSRAYREAVDDAGASGRIVVELPGEDAQDVQLSIPLGPRDSAIRSNYAIALRSDRPRTAVIGADEGVAPWAGLMAPATIQLVSDCRTFVVSIPPRESRAHDRLYVRMGSFASAIEFGPLVRLKASEKVAWHLELAEGSQATLYSREPLFAAANVNDIVTDGAPWSVKVIGLSFSVREGEIYEVRGVIRAEEERKLTLGIQQDLPPNESLSSHVTVQVGPTDHHFVGQFVANRQEPNGVLFIWAGSSDVPFSLEGFRLRPLVGLPRWRLGLLNPQKLRAVGIPGQEEGYRFEALTSETDPWQAKITASLGSVVPGEVYRCRCRLRASEERKVLLGVSLDHDPWTTLGGLTSVRASREAKTFEFDVRFSAPCAAAFFAAVGGDVGTIDIDQFQFERIEPARELTIASGRELVERFASAVDPSATRFELATTDDPWKVKVTSPPFSVEEGTSYLISVRLRADDPRTVLLGIGQNSPPWQSLGFQQTLAVGAESSHFVFVWRSGSAEANAVIYLCLGGPASAIEIADVCCAVAPPSENWYLEAPAGAACRLACDGRSDQARIRVLQATEEAWRIRLTRPLDAVSATQEIRFSGRFRARQPRTIEMGVTQAHQPWENLGFFQRLEIGEDWTEWNASFRPNRDDPSAHFFIWLGKQTGDVDIADFACEVVAAPNLTKSQQNGGGDRKVDQDPHHVDHARDEGA